VGSIQYHHSESATASAAVGVGPAQSSEYELVAAMSGIRAQIYGEDFQDFMHRGATQCSSIHAYLDLFCYQAPTSR
jgi:hypothetical protein